MSTMRQAYVVASKRTAFGKFGGKLKDFKAAELGGIASKAALNTLPKEVEVDQVIFGNVCHTDNSGAYLARHVGHYSGLPVKVPALTVNRLCGSGIQSLISAAQDIRLGEADVVLTGGAENMSMAPYTLHGVRWGTRYGVDQKLEDSLAHALVDKVPGHPSSGHKEAPMGITGENLATKYSITREQSDAFGLLSQQRWAKANAEGAFKAEISPIELKSKKGTEIFEVDEHPRPQTTSESLAKLPPAFKKDGLVTAGTASGMGDGAAANVIMSEDALKKYGVKPLARIVSWGLAAVDPNYMGIGPVEAVRSALRKGNLSLEDMDLIELNEAFATQWLAVQKELGFSLEKANVFGGAIALAHPLGASGARIVANLTHNLHRLDKKYALGTACIGGGQGIAVILERV
ncbi:hypothetical protein FRB94_001682 [Tulasnella sp. JGI-2019a]|nr:hypothetical protein FRB93_007169 [Tulasnella sp. JGI-2019a]KAG9013577.1 hypothetical protein FRB94_001682 [Tulasnella sp. JGI-2019a]KAG9026939.1 hypothetical protein FRB95_008305 [Tulasnella sp. JGI-2019a]